MEYYHSKSPQKRQENSSVKKQRFVLLKREWKTGLFFAYRSFLFGMKKITLATYTAHYPNEKKREKEIASYKRSKWKSLCRETIMITYYLEINWVLHKAKVRASRGKRLRWKSKASGNHHNPHKGQLSCENEEGSHTRENKHKKQKAMLKKKTKTKNPQQTKPAHFITLFQFRMTLNINVIHCIK